MSLPRFSRLSTIGLAGAMFLAPGLPTAAAAESLQSPAGTPSIVVVAATDDTVTPTETGAPAGVATLTETGAPTETATPYDRSTLVREDGVAPGVTGQTEDGATEAVAPGWMRWIYPLAAVALLGSLVNLVIRRRRLIREQELVAYAARDDTVIRHLN